MGTEFASKGGFLSALRICMNLVNLCNDIYNKFPKFYLVHIKGYEWDFGEELTDQARKNLNKAIAYIKDRILEGKDFVN